MKFIEKLWLSKFIYYYQLKFKFRKQDKSNFISFIIYIWKAGFILDRHMRNLVGKDYFKKLVTKRNDTNIVIKNMKKAIYGK